MEHRRNVTLAGLPVGSVLNPNVDSSQVLATDDYVHRHVRGIDCITTTVCCVLPSNGPEESLSGTT